MVAFDYAEVYNRFPVNPNQSDMHRLRLGGWGEQSPSISQLALRIVNQITQTTVLFTLARDSELAVSLDHAGHPFCSVISRFLSPSYGKARLATRLEGADRVQLFPHIATSAVNISSRQQWILLWSTLWCCSVSSHKQRNALGS